MKKLLSLCAALLILCFAAVGSAAAKTGPSIPTEQKISECYQDIWKGAQGKNTKVGVIYLNRAQTTFDDDIDYDILKAVIGAIHPQDHIMVDGTKCVTELAAKNIQDLALAERADMIDVLREHDLDYAVIVQVDPFKRKERMALLRYTLEMTSDIMLRIIDVDNNEYLYNDKVIKMAKHGTAAVSMGVGSVSNKSAVAKVLKDVNKEISVIISTRIPRG